MTLPTKSNGVLAQPMTSNAPLRSVIMRGAVIGPVVGVMIGVLSGCTVKGTTASSNQSVGSATMTGDRTGGVAGVRPSVALGGAGEANLAEPEVGADPVASGARVPVDALVGQVAGQPVYASAILDDIDGTLRQIARQAAPQRDGQRLFEREAMPNIAGRLYNTVNQILIVNEAESRLTDRERNYLASIIPLQRGELIRRYGGGAQSVAEEAILRESGFTLEENLEQFRDEQLVRRYLVQQVRPLIDVSRRDLERYYNDHPELFSPDPRWVLRRICVEDEALAGTVRSRLEGGEDFVAIAAEDLNVDLSPEGLWSGGEAVGPEVFNFAPLNEAYASLEAGAWSGPIMQERENRATRYWFIRVEEIVGGESRSLDEAQREIFQVLFEDQRVALERRYQARLFSEGSYTSLSDMAEDIMDVAIARYLPETD